jgi:hypothetical protein
LTYLTLSRTSPVSIDLKTPSAIGGVEVLGGDRGVEEEPFGLVGESGLDRCSSSVSSTWTRRQL